MYSGNCLFRTGNSLYVVNTEKRTVTGGCFGSEVTPYEKLVSSLIGDPLVIEMVDERILKTSKIVSYS